MVTIQKVSPKDIEEESFRIIEREFKEQTQCNIADYSDEQFQIIRRVIHATGDFSFAHSLYFSQDAINKGKKAIFAGRNIYTDVTMVSAGVSKILTQKYNIDIISKVHDPEVVKIAKERNITRSEAALESCSADDLGVIIIGNAPTALLKTIKLIEEKKISPDLVIGVPVGFVNAAESKSLLIESDICAISCEGRRGGSPVGAAIMNALLKMV